uniref:Putative casein kinase II subunit beta-4 n=1 Tax=Rhizophora mucronata TaxID=61149 RepID=A0A2P2MJ84_RHIMU
MRSTMCRLHQSH